MSGIGCVWDMLGLGDMGSSRLASHTCLGDGKSAQSRGAQPAGGGGIVPGLGADESVK